MQPTLPTLEDGRLRLRWLTHADAAALFTVFSDPEVMRYWGWPAMRSPSEGAELVNSIHEHFARGDLFQWGLERVETPGILGTVTLLHLDLQHGRAELGYALQRACWGQSLMSAALDLVFSHAFTDLGLRRIEADVDPRNTASLRLLEHKGFQREGYLRERWFCNGEICDGIFLGLLRRHWRPRTSGESTFLKS